MGTLRVILVCIGLLYSTAIIADEAKIVVLYGHPKDAAAFDKYYFEKHVPMISKVRAVKRFEYAKTLAPSNGARLPYYLVADILFDSLEELRATQATEEWKEIAADVPNFATGGVWPFVAVIESKKK